MAEVYTKELVIPNGGKLSPAVDLWDASDAEWFDPSVVGIVIPDTWTDADLDFEVSHDGTTYGPLYLSSADVPLTIPAGASRRISVDPKDFVGWQYIKVRSTQNQGGARTVKLLIRDF